MPSHSFAAAPGALVSLILDGGWESGNVRGLGEVCTMPLLVPFRALAPWRSPVPSTVKALGDKNIEGLSVGARPHTD